MLSKLNIYLLAVLALGGLALAVRSLDPAPVAGDPARTDPSVVAEVGAIESSSLPSTGEAPAAPGDPDPTTRWYRSLSELSVPVQFAFAAVRSVVADGNGLRIPIPQVSARATRDLTERWSGEQLGSVQAASSTASRVDDSRGSGIRLFLRSAIRRLGPPRFV